MNCYNIRMFRQKLAGIASLISKIFFNFCGVAHAFQDAILPFFAGLLGVYFLFWMQDLYEASKYNQQVPEPIRMGNIFKEGRVPIVHHRNISHQQKLQPPPESKQDTKANPSWPEGSWLNLESVSNESLVWVVTPTFKNPYQYAELTRIAQALYPVRGFVRWLVIDDCEKSNGTKDHLQKLQEFLSEFSVQFNLLSTTKRLKTQRMYSHPKGTDARRTALDYIKKMNIRGTVYFADDDNTYDSDIFRQMQNTKAVSIWPTGAITEWTVSSPIVREGKVVEFFDAFTANRRFPVDFASFAFNASLLYEKARNVTIPYIISYQETMFLRTLNVSKEEFEPLCNNATDVLTWHTKTIHTVPLGEQKTGKRKIMRSF